MKPAARIQTTIDILDIIDARKLPMDLLVGDYMRNRRYIGSKDRREIVERVYDIARHHARLSYILTESKIEPHSRNKTLAYLRFYEGLEAKRIDDLFDGTKYSPDVLSDEERDFTTRDIDLSKMPAHMRVECPELYREKLEAYFGDDFEAEMEAMIPSATLDVRVNSFTSNREKVINYLEADGVQAIETPYSPWGLRIQGKAYLSKTKAFSKRWIEIQDEGSQMIAYVCGVKPGMQVLDYCAGGGGKTLALAAMMQKKGRLVATDIDARRLEKGRRRLKKSGLADIIEVRPLSDEKNRKWLRRQKGTFDVVLCDVPCTGTGTWRRNPDMRWSVYGPSLEELTIIQSEIMDKVAHTLKPGGKLVYATCSLLPDENEHQVEAFLARNSDFKVAAIDPALKIGSPFMRLTPHRNQTDGFFAAALERKT